MRWKVKVRTVVLPVEQHGSQIGIQPRQHWAEVIVETIAGPLGDHHPRNGWVVDGRPLEAVPEDMGAPAPQAGLVMAVACRAQTAVVPAAKISAAYSCERLSDAPDAPAPPLADPTKPLPRATLESMKFFALRKHVKETTGVENVPDMKTALLVLEQHGKVAA